MTSAVREHNAKIEAAREDARRAFRLGPFLAWFVRSPIVRSGSDLRYHAYLAILFGALSVDPDG